MRTKLHVICFIMLYFKQFHRIWFVISVASLCGMLYGILFSIWEMEDNSCRMTYMFEYPQFVRIRFEENANFPRYGLYAYSEGYLTKKVRSMKFTGAPVIFIPGNGGSYRQARSLASVAIRKGIDNDWKQHLDYFSLDLNEEYSALFGGFLEKQKDFLQFCIIAVLKLYDQLQNAPKQVVLIGHSMGGKIAQSILIEKEYSKYINTIISISSPLDRPVINIDGFFEAFYRNIEETLSQQRTMHVNSTTNYCETIPNTSANKTLDKILLISIGGGTRDILVHAGLTHSKYSDIHALTTSIPNVWLSTDHLCSVWCLQLVLVVNRFLHSIITQTKSQYGSAQHFIEEKETITRKARYYFMKSLPTYRENEINLVSNLTKIGVWREDFRKVYTKYFRDGINITTVEMIRFIESNQYKMLYVRILNIESDDWIFACAAVEIHNNMRFCSKATPLNRFINKLPSRRHRMHIVSLNLQKIKLQNPLWTHIILRLSPTKEKINMHVDMFDPADRTIHIESPKWYSFSEKIVLKDTRRGISSYEIKIHGLDASYKSLAINLKPKSCKNSSFNVIMQVCVPWSRGCEKYQTFTNERSTDLYVYVTNSRPVNNAVNNSVSVKLHLDPTCRYTISYKNSLGSTLSRIGQHYFHWLPAHITAILLLGLRYQISVTSDQADFKCGKLNIALFSSSSLFMLTATRLFGKFLYSANYFPQPDPSPSMLILVIIHGSTLAFLALFLACLWITVIFCGKLVNWTLLKLIELPVPTLSDGVFNVIEKIPLSAGVVLIAITCASCGEIALICGCFIYFTLIAKQYENYLQEFIYGKVKILGIKLVSTFPNKCVNNFKNASCLEEPKKNKSSDHKKEIHIVTEEDLEDIEDSKNIPIRNINTQEEQKVRNPTNESLHEEQKKALEMKECDEMSNRIHFHITIFLLFLTVTLINIPSALTWTNNYRYSQSLTPDPSLMPAIVVISCTSILWQFSTPRNVCGYFVVTFCLYVCACICVLYCLDCIYRLNSLISLVFLIVTTHQLSAPKRKMEDEDKDIEDDLQSNIQRILQGVMLRN